MSASETTHEKNSFKSYMHYVTKGELSKLPRKVQRHVSVSFHQYNPRSIYICDGSREEADELVEKLLESKAITHLKKYKSNYLCRIDPDNAPQNHTFICTPAKSCNSLQSQDEMRGMLHQWMGPIDIKQKTDDRFSNCMAGRVMYVIPFMFGPIGSPFSMIGVQVTDSIYVLLSMRVMALVSNDVWKLLGNGNFIKSVHTMGCPRPLHRNEKHQLPNDPERRLVAIFPKERRIKCFGEEFGTNSILERKYLSLGLANFIALENGWMAEHMMIMSITTPHDRAFFVAIALSENCGRTSLALMTPQLPGYKVKCVGKDVAWMWFSKTGQLMAVNPENGLSGRASGLNLQANAMARRMVQSNTLFTNVAETDAGDLYLDGMNDSSQSITDWRGHPWPGATLGPAPGPNGPPSPPHPTTGPAAHPDASFLSPGAQCPAMHHKWNSPDGVPVSAIIFCSRRPRDVPLVYEAKSWAHGVMIGACLKSEVYDKQTKEKKLIHYPMAMGSYVYYNFGQYLQHWLDMEKGNHKMPKIFHVNWFQENDQGKILWPGFGHNLRVLDWILRRCDGDDNIHTSSPIGYLPKRGCINMSGISEVDLDLLLNVPVSQMLKESLENKSWIEEKLGSLAPTIIIKLLKDQEKELKLSAATEEPSNTKNSIYYCLSKPRRKAMMGI